MDGSAFLPTNHYVTGEIVAASATATACAAWLASYLRRQTVRRRERSSVPVKGIVPESPSKLLLQGDYRGRRVNMTQAGEWLRITVRAVNGERVFAEFGNGDRISLPWVTMACRQRLAVVAAKWSVDVRGGNILLSCHGIDQPERLWFALDVACDVADAVDNVRVSRRSL